MMTRLGLTFYCAILVASTTRAADSAPGVTRSCGRLVVAHADALCFADAQMTVEAWIRPQSRPTSRWLRIVSKYGGGPGRMRLRGWEFSLRDDGRLHFRAVPFREDGEAPWIGIASKGVIPVQQWTHVACAVDAVAGCARIYVNGVLDAEQAVNVSRLQVNPGQDLYIGVYGEASMHWFEGLVDEVRLSRVALKFDGVPSGPYSGSDPATVALYHFDEQRSGGVFLNAADSSAHTAVLVDGDLPAQAPSMPGFGDALRLGEPPRASTPFQPTAFETLPHPTVEELGLLGARWQERWPKRVRSEPLGRGADDLPLHMLTITDFSVPDDDKEIVLLVAMHTGGEISGATGLLAFAEWLSGDDPTASRIRARQVCVLVPVPNPWGYARRSSRNKWKRDPAWCWAATGATHQDENPEGVLIQGLIERLQPEVVVDSHGTWWKGQYMGEFVGSSGYSLVLNTFQGSIVREMSKAAAALGFPQHLAGESHEKILTSEPVPGYDREFFTYLSATSINACIYAYTQCHAIPLTMESGGWAGSAVARLRRLMEIGCERWETEFYPGYPNRRIGTRQAWMQWLAAYGTTAAARRLSRAELWRKQSQFVTFRSYPDADRGFFFGLTTTAEMAAKAFAGRSRREERFDYALFFQNLEQIAGVNVRALQEHLHTIGCTGTLALDPRPHPVSGGNLSIEHGLAIRGMIPYSTPAIVDVRANGTALVESATDGYQVWPGGSGGTYLQVNIPPAQVGGLHIVTCLYNGNEQREWGYAVEAAEKK